jgi:uncharacterized protein (DUF58 family)
MSSLSEILSAEDITSVQRLQLFARTVVEGFTTGLHASPHKGFSVEFRQHRPYVQGDEIRRLDWKVFGRSDRFYIREYDEETNLRATLVLDTSGSMGYRGTGGVLKLDYARKLAASLAHLLMSQQDAVGMLTFDTKMRRVIPNRSKLSHLRLLLRTLIDSEPGGETALSSVLESLGTHLKRRGLVILISDLFEDPEQVVKALGVLRHQGQEIVVMQLWDRDELDFSFSRWARFENLEIDDDHIQVDPAAIRQQYLKVLASHRQRLQEGLRRHQVDFLPMVTDEPHAQVLRRYLTLRMQR